MWQNVRTVTDPDGREWYKCMLYSGRLTSHQASNIAKHLSRCKERHPLGDSESPRLSDLEATHLFCKMIVANALPFRLADNKVFEDYCERISFDKVFIPHSSTVWRAIATMYEQYQCAVDIHLQNLNCTIHYS